MEGIFTEHENENGLRSYPFAGGTVDGEYAIPTGLFVDAAIYPVNPSGVVYLSSVSADGELSVSDDSGVIMSGRQSGAVVELYDSTPFKRHTGTLVASSEDALSEFCGRGVDVEFEADNTAFASACVFPVVIDGVVSLSVGDAGTACGDVSFSNGPSDEVRVSIGEKFDRKTLRFDVLPRPGIADEAFIKRVICVVDGQTPFRIGRNWVRGQTDEWYNTVVLELDGIDKDLVCASAHRENSFEMADTCECGKKPVQEDGYLPEAYQLEEVYIPPDPTGDEGGLAEGADNAFYLVVPNIMRIGSETYMNPLSITLEDGTVSPKVEDPEVVIDGFEAVMAEGEMLDKVTSKSVVIQVPGLSGGQI